MNKVKKLKLVIVVLIFFNVQNAFSHSGFTVKDFVNHTDPFSKALVDTKKIVIEEPYKLYKGRKYLDCYKTINKILESGNAGEFKTDLLSLMITCYVSTPRRKRPEFNTKYDLFSDSILVKKIFRDLGHDTIKKMIEKREFSLSNESLLSNVFKKPGIVCLFKAKKDFANQLLNRIAKREDFFSLNLQKLPCDFELNDDYRFLLEDRETYSLYQQKGVSVFNKRAQVRFKYIKNKISKREYSKFRRLSKGRKAQFLKNISDFPDYVVNKITKNLFYRNKFSLLENLLANDDLPMESLSYIVKANVAEGKYDKVLKMSDDLKFEKSRSSEEILLMRSGVYLRQQKFGKAQKELEKMRKYIVDLKLSSLYWRWVALVKLGKSSEALSVSKELLEGYPFSYYGILVASHHEGRSFFEKYSKNYSNYKVELNGVTKKDINRLKAFYRMNWVKAFRSTYKDLEKFLSPKERALFALAFSNLGKTQETIKILNSEWDNDAELRAEPFLSKSFSFLFSDTILEEAKKNKRVSPAIVRAVIRQESAFQEKVKSGSGAKGLMQLMNPTAREVAKQLRVKRFNPNKNLYDGKLNIKLGSKYMDRLISANNDYLPYAFASYNAGPGKMNRWSSKRDEIYELKKGLEYRKETVDNVNEFWVEELPWVETRFYTKALLRNMGIYIALAGQKKSFECRPFWTCQ